MGHTPSLVRKQEQGKHTMGTDRKLNKTVNTRPTKRPGDRRRRLKNQRQRLVALGLDEETVRKMTEKKIRELLRNPNKTAAKAAK
jgi:hypothetical protein